MALGRSFRNICSVAKWRLKALDTEIWNPEVWETSSACAIIDPIAQGSVFEPLSGERGVVAEGIQKMGVDVRQVDGSSVMVLVPHGTLGQETGRELQGKISDLLELGSKEILLNLGDVDMMDSSGLGALVRCYTTVTNRGGQVKLCGLNKKVEDLLSVTKLIMIFSTHENEAAAVASFR